MRRRTRVAGSERGSASLETVMLAPALLALLLVAVYGGRVALARQSVQAAASDAARSASIARTESVAVSSARASAEATLAAEGVRCVSTQITLDTSAFSAPVGATGSVAATVVCTVDLTDLVAPGVPGTRVMTATVTSPLDTYRERS
jgi:Flp pilus assembly protein TadG